MPRQPVKPPTASEGPRVEFQLRWFLLLLSGVILFALRHHKMLFIAYAGLVVGLVLLYLLWLPGRVRAAEQRFGRDCLKLMAADDAPGLKTLAGKQWLLRLFGPKHLLPDALGMAAAAQNDHATARTHFLEALQHAPTHLKPRIQLNLARAEMESGHLGQSEGRYRAILSRRPTASVQGQLGRLLVLQGEAFDEAIELLQLALQSADSKETPALQLALAEALKMMGDPAWKPALKAAEAAGCAAASLQRVRTLKPKRR